VISFSSDALSLRRNTRQVLRVFEDRIRKAGGLKFLVDFFKCLRTEDKEFGKFFDDGVFRVIGIDGSMCVEERLELLLIYVCAAGYYGKIYVNDGVLKVDASGAEREEALKVSTSVPLWLEDLPNVNPSSVYALTDFDVKRSIESIPYALMTLSELILALDSVMSGDVKVIFLDRLLSGTYGPVSRDFRLMLRRGYSVLNGFNTPYGKVSMLDLHLSGFLGTGDEFIPKRGVYGAYALIKMLIDLKREDKGIRTSDVAGLMGVSVKEARGFINKVKKLDRHYDGLLLDLSDNDEILMVRDEVVDYWRRVWFATRKFADRIFSGEEHPLMLDNEGSRWITTLDINTINVYLLHKIVSDAVSNHKLVIGIAKDTSSTDIIRSVFPIYCKFHGKSRLTNISPLTFRSDKVLLSIISSSMYESIPTPWRVREYDYCFATLVYHEDPKRSDVFARAARKIIFREKLFVRGYFQLRSLEDDPSVRSAVFAYDRPFYPEFDSNLIVKFECLEGKRTSNIKPLLEVEENSFIGNLVLYILSQSDNPYVIEEMGHNHLLFLADKLVKVMAKRARDMLRGIADLDLGTIASKYKAYFSSRRFRDIRREAEHARERMVKRSYGEEYFV